MNSFKKLILASALAVFALSACNSGNSTTPGDPINSEDPGTSNKSGTFVSVWKTNNFGKSDSNQIALPLEKNGKYDFIVDWGDGTTNSIDSWNDSATTHTYAKTGEYEVRISGLIKGFSFSSNKPNDPKKLLKINEWGPLQLGNAGYYFYNAINMTISAKDILNLEGTTVFLGMFASCSSLVEVPGIENWDVSRVTNMGSMFWNATAFNSDLSNWDVSRVTDMGWMFESATAFNSDLSNWDVSRVTDMGSMFSDASEFNSDLSNWDVSSVTSMSYMFQGASKFNSDLSNWDVSRLTDMIWMFDGASKFNSDLSNWDVSRVTNMGRMFSGASNFKSDLSKWDVSRVTSMSYMFNGASNFNSDLSNWDVSRVTDMRQMFRGATPFNGDLSNWDVSRVTDMGWMFSGASNFNSDLSHWDVSRVTDMSYMFYGVTLSTANYDALLLSWSEQKVKNTVDFSGGNSKYSAAAAGARQKLIDTYGWKITDGGLAK